jgi:hypothetical protein
MAKKRKRAQKVELHYPKHALKPEDMLHFIELRPFSRNWKRLELDDELDLLALQLAIMAEPKRPAVIEGTYGLRKMRFAPEDWGQGKSGAVRVLYVYFEEFHVALLCVVYPKNERDDISAATKKAVNKAIRAIEKELRRRKTIA